MTDKNVSQLVINKLTQAQYEAASAAGDIRDTELYFITDTNEAVIDDIVIQGSTNAVTGGAVYDAIAAIPTPDVSGQINAHNNDDTAHSDIRVAIDTLGEEIDGKLSGKANTSHDHNNVYYTETEVDALLNGKSDTSHKHDNDYDVKGAADTAVSTHNTSTSAHNDIRVLITDLTTKLNNFLDVDDTTTDQLSEVLTLIDNNKGTLESLTTSKVNVSDIIDNLTTSSATKVLSAKQGVDIKALIDALDANLDELEITVSGKADKVHIHNDLNNIDDIHDIRISDLEEKVGDGLTEMTEAEIRAFFA